MPGAGQRARAHGLQRFEMGRDGPPRGKITSRRRHDGPAATREQRAQQQHRSAKPADQRAIRFVLGDFRAADRQLRPADAVDLGAEIEQQARHHFDVARSVARS